MTGTGRITGEEFSVLRPYARGVDQESIGKQLSVSFDKVNEIVMRTSGLNRQRAAELVRTYMFEQQGKVAAAMPAPVTFTDDPGPATTAEPLVRPRLDALLAAGEAHTQARIRSLAARIRALVDTLDAVLQEEEQAHLATVAAQAERTKTLAKVERLKRELAEAQAALKPGKAKPASSEAKKIRLWAAKNNVACSRAGRVNDSAVAAYRAAHPTAAQS